MKPTDNDELGHSIFPIERPPYQKNCLLKRECFAKIKEFKYIDKLLNHFGFLKVFANSRAELFVDCPFCNKIFGISCWLEAPICVSWNCLCQCNKRGKLPELFFEASKLKNENKTINDIYKEIIQYIKDDKKRSMRVIQDYNMQSRYEKLQASKLKTAKTAKKPK